MNWYTHITELSYSCYSYITNVCYPFAVDFDKLGLTDNENPYGDFPTILARSMSRSVLSMMTDYVGQYLEKRRGKRSVNQELAPEVEMAVLDRLHGGERWGTLKFLILLVLKSSY